jgi:DNA-binding transcriptional MocR family regulator
VHKLSTGTAYTGYPQRELDPRLAETLKEHLPLEPRPDNTILATHVLGAMSELFPVLGGPYTKVVVGDPEFAPYLDLLERFRLEPQPVPMDDDGLVLESVRAAAIGFLAAARTLHAHVSAFPGVISSLKPQRCRTPPLR